MPSRLRSTEVEGRCCVGVREAGGAEATGDGKDGESWGREEEPGVVCVSVCVLCGGFDM